MATSKNGNPLETAEMEITMLGNSEHDQAIQDYLKDAGFLVKNTDKVSPNWSTSLGKEALEDLSLPQLDNLVRVAHTDLSQRIANDVKQGMSVEEAYMFRASTDPAAILIAQASIIKQDKLVNALSELKQSADLGKQALATSFELKENFQKVYFEKTYQPNEKRGLEQAQYWISESIKKNPTIASLIATKAVKELMNDKINWREPELTADKIITSIKENTKDKDLELSALSTQDFIKHAAKEYVRKFSEIENSGHDKGTASSVAVAHIKTLASKAKLKILLKDLPDKVLQAASKSPQEVEKLLSGRVKPSRLAVKSKSLENKMER